jgi:aminodeoxyfutalosine deaminase
MTFFEAEWICPISSPSINHGWFSVDAGKIIEIGAGACPAADRLELPGCAIIPGFVNAHTHLELTILRGFLENLPFANWISRLTQAKYRHLSPDEIRSSARLGAIEMLRAGVTCIGEVMDLGVSWPVMKELGLQGIAYQEVFGPAEDQASAAMADLVQKITGYRTGEAETQRVGVSPHAPYTVSAKLFREVNAFARRENLRLTTHVAESEDEGMFVRSGAGCFAQRLTERGISFTPGRCSPIAYLDQLGLLRPETLLVHAVDTEDSDFEILREKRSPVVHCPKSNAKLGHGFARLPEIRDTGISVGLGTDSVASNNVVDLFEEMRTAIFFQRASTRSVGTVTAMEAFRMATLGGAECLGLEQHLGSLEPRKRADFVVVDLNDVAVQPVYDPIETMVYSASRKNIRATYLAGREVTIDPSEVINACKAVALRLSGL